MLAPPRRGSSRVWNAAVTALVIRQLLLQETVRLGIAVDADASGETGSQEALVQELLAREVATPKPDEVNGRDRRTRQLPSRIWPIVHASVPRNPTHNQNPGPNI